MKEKNIDKAIKYLFFLVYPWISLVYSLRSLNQKSTYYIILGFCILFGLAFTPDLNSKLDSVYYLKYFEDNKDISWLQYLNDLYSYFEYEGAKKDIYLHTMTFLVSCVTANYHFFFASLAVVFSYLYLKSFRYLTLNNQFINNDKVCILLALMFTVSNPVFNINGARFWTAAWMAIYLTFKIIIDGKMKYAFLLLLLPLVHGSFWVYLILFIPVVFIRNTKLLFVVFMMSFFVSGLMLTFIRDMTAYLPATLNRFISVYTSDEYIARRDNVMANASWFSVLFLLAKSIYPNMLIYYIVKQKNRIKSNNVEVLLKFILVLAIFVNLTITIPALGNRFQMLLYPILALLWFYNLKIMESRKWLIYLFPLVFLQDFYELFVRISSVLDPYFYVAPLGYFLYYIIGFEA